MTGSTLLSVLYAARSDSEVPIVRTVPQKVGSGDDVQEMSHQTTVLIARSNPKPPTALAAGKKQTRMEADFSSRFINGRHDSQPCIWRLILHIHRAVC